MIQQIHVMNIERLVLNTREQVAIAGLYNLKLLNKCKEENMRASHKCKAKNKLGGLFTIKIEKPFRESFYTESECCRRLKVYPSLKSIRIGRSFNNITGLHGLKMLDCFTTQRLLHQLNEVQQLRGLAVTDVKHTMWSRRSGWIRLKRIKVRINSRWFIATAHHTFNDVIDISEIAVHLAMVEHLDRLTSQDCPSKQHRSHVGSATGAIHREKPQTGRWQSIKVAVSVSHQLIGLLAGGIKAHRVINWLAFMKWQIAVASVNRAA